MKKFKISEEDSSGIHIRFASPSDSQLMELEQIRILKPDDEEEMESPSPSKTEEILGVVPLSCAFTRQEHCVSETKEREESIRRLSSLIFLYLIVMSVQIVGGFKANSLAVMTDAAHLLSDVAGLGVSLLAIKVSKWEANSRNSFGFKRLEVLAAFLSVQLIWLVSGVIIHEAIQRLVSRSREVNGEIMFGISAFGFFMNLVMVLWLGHNHSHHHHHHHHHQHHHKEVVAEEEEEEMNPLKGEKSSTKEMNINIQGAYLHAMADMIQSLGVMIGGGIIWVKPKWVLVDLICTLVFSAFALAATLPMLKNIFGILMERVPRDTDIEKLERGLKRIDGVKIVYDLHVWEITVGRIVLSCHILPEPGASPKEIITGVRNFCRKSCGIYHVTIQVESE
ncbi:Cation efflux protein cytoplasmic domain superfamily [Arabidopsis thaliana x Arabidopsis arenosa]|uniref:Cation efflux protein cytoplasmic domain superfamily n=1 Tax=Arabidopsis thaliana x Arabidopsis arenosa TaxID=1240361 RepID=A0A8T2A5Q7_9BRAS|nr:Cation efflux protein cytoplasmic domain superfamily [Arabidopsis thaliana x Arabidopsis arenosa]